MTKTLGIDQGANQDSIGKLTKVAVAKGDGIGPEIMDATLKILNAAEAQIQVEEVEIGEQVYKSGHTSGITPKAWDTIRECKVFLKAPITTPQGGGYKSLNVTMRKTLGLYANIRPCLSFYPYIETKHPKVDIVIIRENEEDLYAGIEHQQTDEVVQCLKLITRPGCEKIVRHAFEYARQYNRKKVTCFSKDNIMKQTDGLFHRVFDEISQEYPDIISEHRIVDIGAALLADRPEDFDVVVLPNLYGDIISDIAAQITGSVGLGGSSNIGASCAMFEAIHGSAPDIAGKQIANPSGLIQASVLMLNHIGQSETAEKIQNALLKTIEDGVHTRDIYKEGSSKQLVNTAEFADAVIERMGQKPEKLNSISYPSGTAFKMPEYKRQPAKKKELLGVDLFVHWAGTDPNEAGRLLQQLNSEDMQLTMITNRGVKVWPNGFEETFCTDHWRCRFQAKDGKPVAQKAIVEALNKALEYDVDVIKTENLYAFDGKVSFSLGQGQ